MTDLIPASFPLVPMPDPAAVPVPAAEAAPPKGVTAKKKNKVRAAWIAFAGRVTAQLIGAIATVGLGVAVVSHAAKPVASTAAPVVGTASGVAAVPVPGLTHASAGASGRTRRAAGPALVVLPFQDFSAVGSPTRLADGVTEAVTAALARSGRIQVTSRTTAMQYRASVRPLPAIAAELGVDVVVEGSIFRQGDHVRVTVQLIDAASDVHLWAQTYDRPVRDVLAFQADISASIDHDLAGVLPRGLQAPVPATAGAMPSPAGQRVVHDIGRPAS